MENGRVLQDYPIHRTQQDTFRYLKQYHSIKTNNQNYLGQSAFEQGGILYDFRYLLREN